MDEATRKRRLLIILYFGFISLGLPDTVLGVAWPQMRLSFDAPLELAGLLISMTTIISVFSSLAAGWVMKRYNAGKILTVCAFMTAAAMLGYGLAPAVMVVAAFTVLFGVGQGAVDSAVNAYMSKNYSSKQMNWIHACWGLGATGGPLVFTAAFGLGLSWRAGYLTIFAIQFCLGLLFLFTLKLWPDERNGNSSEKSSIDPDHSTDNLPENSNSLMGAISGVAFYLFYPGVEVVTGLWGASYLVEVLGCEAATAGAAITMYWGSLTIGRFAIGFVAEHFSNTVIMRGSLAAAAIGAAIIFFSSTVTPFFAALAFIGLGLSPMYPTMMHETPRRVGLKRSDMVVSFQVGAALAGAAIIPVLTGFIARRTSLEILPLVLIVFIALLILSHEVSAKFGDRP